jgi:nitrogen fixation regulatory protein
LLLTEQLADGVTIMPAKEKMAEALGAFLSSPPAGTPVELIEAFGRRVATNDGVLPPRVFLEVVDQSPVAISITDTRANFVYVNQAFERLTGYTYEELMGKNQSILSYKVTPPEVYQQLWGNLAAHKPWSGVLVNRRRDGTRYLADLNVAPVLGVGGEASYYLALHRDVTDLHELEQQVRNQKVLIETVVDAAPVIIALLDEQGRVLLDNMAYKKLLGDMQGREPAAFFLQELQAACDAVASTGVTNQEICYQPESDRPARWFDCSGVWVSSSGSTADSYFVPGVERRLLLVANEITAQKLHQERIRTSAMQALMAEQQLVHRIRETLSGAMFRFQGPLNIVSAAINMLERRAGGRDDPLYRILVDVRDNGEQVLESLDLSLPKESNEPVVPINLNEVVHDVLELCTQRMLNEGVLVDWQPAQVLPPVLGRQYAMHSLLKQLVDNAIDAIGEPGCQRRELYISTAADEEYVEVTVRDTGPGIPHGKQFRVFEPFYSAWKYRTRQAGMGLTIAQEVVIQHGGTIRIDTQYTDGCLVQVLLPLKPPAHLLREAGS